MTSNPEHGDSVNSHIYLFVWGKAGKVVGKMLARCVVVGCSNIANVQEVLRFMPYRFMER